MTSDISDANRTVVFQNPPGSKEFTQAKIPVATLNEEMMDAAFTKAVGCTQYPGGCDGMRKDHRFADAVPLGDHWKHKYLIDFDGMGYSARLFSFLMSESAVIKATVYKEFFSDWIQPWYVPRLTTYLLKKFLPLGASAFHRITVLSACWCGAPPCLVSLPLPVRPGAEGMCTDTLYSNQATLHPFIVKLFRDLQHTCLLFRGFSLHA